MKKQAGHHASPAFCCKIGSDHSVGSSPCTIGLEVSKPKLFGASRTKVITIAIDASNVAVVAISLTIISPNSSRERNVPEKPRFH
jgi:hypothetical protein